MLLKRQALVILAVSYGGSLAARDAKRLPRGDHAAMAVPMTKPCRLRATLPINQVKAAAHESAPENP